MRKEFGMALEVYLDEAQWRTLVKSGEVVKYLTLVGAIIPFRGETLRACGPNMESANVVVVGLMSSPLKSGEYKITLKKV